MLKISDICVSLEADGQDVLRAACKKSGIPIKNVTDFKIVKKSVDARKKNDIKFNYAVNVSLNCPEERFCSANVSAVSAYKYQPVKADKAKTPPVVVGSGPAGLLAALILAQAGQNPILAERGQPADLRKIKVDSFHSGGELDTECNVQFGEGGAGTFSDGKLTTGIKDVRMGKVIEEFIRAGAPEEIGYLAKPHIGTDKLIEMVQNIRKEIIRLGGDVRFGTKLCDIKAKKGRICSVVLEEDGERYEQPADRVILAIGHSARDTFEMLLRRGVDMIQKPFSVGARIEHRQSLINESQYGKFAGHPALGAADYKLSAHLPDGRGVYTFCMCPGGTVVASASEKNAICTNGMSVFARDGQNANSALLVGVEPKDFGSSHPLAGVEFQRKIERAAYDFSGSYIAPAQLVGDFLDNISSSGKSFGSVAPTYRPGVALGKIDCCLPDFVTNSMRAGLRLFERKIKGFSTFDAVLTAPETRSSSPVRITRNENCESITARGLYPCGEGAGYAGGIMSAAVDGIKCAEAVLLSIKNE
ncbi:MAG: FAD-binding protein [Clostridia bacterium]|nr:FAD-binding protein [Clostridia bacterium]